MLPTKYILICLYTILIDVMKKISRIDTNFHISKLVSQTDAPSNVQKFRTLPVGLKTIMYPLINLDVSRDFENPVFSYASDDASIG